MGAHKGVELLVDAFEKINSDDYELWFCGRGHNARVENAASNHPRIRNFGLVPQKKLDELLRGASILVNPRAPKNVLNTRNFPSKILLYLSYGKPVVSMWTTGLSPEYRDVLEVVEGETSTALAEKLKSVMSWSQQRRQQRRGTIDRFLRTKRLWSIQAERLLNWIDAEFSAADSTLNSRPPN